MNLEHLRWEALEIGDIIRLTGVSKRLRTTIESSPQLFRSITLSHNQMVNNVLISKLIGFANGFMVKLELNGLANISSTCLTGLLQQSNLNSLIVRNCDQVSNPKTTGCKRKNKFIKDLSNATKLIGVQQCFFFAVW